MLRRTRPTDTDDLGELPPLDEPDAEDVEGPSDEEILPLLSPIEEDVDLDEDEQPPDVELGTEVEEQETDADEPGDVVLDMSELLSVTEDDERPEDADTAGPAILDLAADLDVDGRELLGSTEEGTDEPPEDLVSEDLPELDADEPGGLDDEPSWLALDALRDEDLPPRANPWLVERMELATSDLTSLARAPDGLVAGGSGIAFVATGALVGLGNGRAVALVAVGPSKVVVLTAAGELVLVSPGAGPEPVTGFLESLALRPDAAIEPGLVELPEGALAVHVGGSELALSDDGGRHFTRFEVGGSIVATSPAGTAPFGLLRTAEGFALAELQPGARRQGPLDAVADEVARGDRPLLAAKGDVVALASAERGLVLSSDRGHGFARVPGCLHATALALGRRDGAARVWVSVFLETEARALVIEVDVASRRAAVVAELLGEDEEDELDARVRALLWDEGDGVLWAATSTELNRLRPTD